MKENIIESLNIMWKGMLAIFIVISIIILATIAVMRIEKSVVRKKAQALASKESQSQEQDAE